MIRSTRISFEAFAVLLCFSTPAVQCHLHHVYSAVGRQPHRLSSAVQHRLHSSATSAKLAKSLLARGGGSSSGYSYNDDYDDDWYSNRRDPRRHQQQDALDDDDGYYNDSKPQRSSRSSNNDSISTLLYKLQHGDRQLGILLLSSGAGITLVGISLFFNKMLLRLGNLAFMAGVPVTMGPSRTIRYLGRPEKLRATLCLGLGVLLVWVGWPMLGMVLEVFGLLNLFGNMFPFVWAIAKNLPVLGPILKATSGEGGGSTRTNNHGSRKQPKNSNYYYDEDEDEDYNDGTSESYGSQQDGGYQYGNDSYNDGEYTWGNQGGGGRYY